MGTIVAVKKGNQGVIATDCWNLRDPMMKNSINTGGHCIIRIGDSFVGLNSTAGFQSAFEEAVQQIGPKNFTLGSRSEIFLTFSKIHDFMRQQSYMLVHFQNAQDFEWTPMNALVLNKTGLYKVDTTRAVYEFTKFWAIGTGESYALGGMQIAQETKDSEGKGRTPEEIAKMGLRAVQEFDPSAGCEEHFFHLQPPLVALGSSSYNDQNRSEQDKKSESNSKLKKLPSRNSKVTKIK